MAEMGEPKTQQNNNQNEKEYVKEYTIILETTTKVTELLNSIIETVGHGKLLALRPRQNGEYELTLKDRNSTDRILNGLMINGQVCEARPLINSDMVVSFMYLPAYLKDEVIFEKLNLWGVTPLQEIRRRYYPGTDITDGTRYVKVRFPKDVVSLPYSTKFETEEGQQYFRVIHSRQVKTCRLCMNPGHLIKDCPKFTCRECYEQGHYAKDCTAARCPDCQIALIRCECQDDGRSEHDEEGTTRIEALEKGKNSSQTEETDTREENGRMEKEDQGRDEGKDVMSEENIVKDCQSAGIAHEEMEQEERTGLTNERRDDTEQKMNATQNMMQGEVETGEDAWMDGENGQEETEGDRGKKQEKSIKDLHKNKKEMEDTRKSGIKEKPGTVRKKTKILNLEKVLKRQKEKRGILKTDYLKDIGADVHMIQEEMEELND